MELLGAPVRHAGSPVTPVFQARPLAKYFHVFNHMERPIKQIQRMLLLIGFHDTVSPSINVDTLWLPYSQLVSSGLPGNQNNNFIFCIISCYGSNQTASFLACLYVLILVKITTLLQIEKMAQHAQRAMEAVPPPPARFTLTEWYLNNRQRYRQAEDQQHLAERILGECDRVRDEVDDIVDKNKKEVEHHLEVKLADIEFRKKQLEEQKKELDLEVDALKTFKARIEDAQRALNINAHSICTKCIVLREGRLGIDLCHDDVERELLKEREVIEGAQSLLERSMEQVNEQLRRLRALIYSLVKDLNSKAGVLTIDRHNRGLKETSLNLSLYHGTTPLDPGNVTGEEWALYTQQTIDRAAKELVSGRPIRSYINQLLKQVIEDLWKQYYVTNDAFSRRIAEYKEAKAKLENKHFETVRQANEMVREITRLEKAIADKEGFMALAHTRLGNRAQRKGIELCRDEVELKLMNEIEGIREGVTKLQHMLAEAQASLRYLLKTQVQLEEDINIKTNSLKIDEVDCMTLRLGMDYHAY